MVQYTTEQPVMLRWHIFNSTIPKPDRFLLDQLIEPKHAAVTSFFDCPSLNYIQYDLKVRLIFVSISGIHEFVCFLWKPKESQNYTSPENPLRNVFKNKHQQPMGTNLVVLENNTPIQRHSSEKARYSMGQTQTLHCRASIQQFKTARVAIKTDRESLR